MLRLINGIQGERLEVRKPPSLLQDVSTSTDFNLQNENERTGADQEALTAEASRLTMRCVATPTL